MAASRARFSQCVTSWVARKGKQRVDTPRYAASPERPSDETQCDKFVEREEWLSQPERFRRKLGRRSYSGEFRPSRPYRTNGVSSQPSTYQFPVPAKQPLAVSSAGIHSGANFTANERIGSFRSLRPQDDRFFQPGTFLCRANALHSLSMIRAFPSARRLHFNDGGFQPPAKLTGFLTPGQTAGQ